MPKYQITESIHIDASPQRVFEAVADYRTWTTWSPWLICEPEAKVTVSPDPSSVGSTYAWLGDLTGQGQMIHQKLEPYRAIEDELTFLKPFKSVCRIGFRIDPEFGGSKLTWTMNGSLPWFLFFMVSSMKTILSMDFRRGLLMLKDLLEKGSIPSQSTVHGVVTIPQIRMAGIADTALIHEIGPAMNQAIQTAKSEFARAGLSTSKPPVSVYTRFAIAKQTFDFIAGYEIGEGDRIDPNGPLKVWSTPSNKAFRIEHVGSYHHLGNPWAIANGICRHKKLKQRKEGTFEIYRNWPGEVPESELVTDIYLPLR
jgi:effector-binding domain-containing protein